MTIHPRVGIGSLIFNEQNQLLLGKRKGSHGDNTWGNPGGHLEFGESFETCIIREIYEETGLKITITPVFVGMTNAIFVHDNKHYVSIFMKVDLPQNQEVINREPDKVESWQWFSMDDLPDNLFLPLKQIIAEHGIDKIFDVVRA